MSIHNLRFELLQDYDGLWYVSIYCNSDHLHTAVNFATEREAEIFGDAFIKGIQYMLEVRR